MPDCKVCHKIIEKRLHESVARHEAKQFCSPFCCKAYMREHQLGWFKRGRTLGQLPKHDWNDFSVRTYPTETED